MAEALDGARAHRRGGPEAQGRPGARRRALLLAGLLAALAVGTFGVRMLPRRAAAPGRPPGAGPAEVAPTRDSQPSVAVLPLVNLSPDRENEYFSDGMTEELITALGKVEGLRVAARTSAFAFKGTDADVREIGAEAQRRHGAGGKRAARGAAAPALGAAGEHQGRVPHLVGRVRPGAGRRVRGAGRAGAGDRGCAPGDAAAAGRRGAGQGGDRRSRGARPLPAGALPVEPADLRVAAQAVRYFERAIARDSTYAEAYAALAETYVLFPIYGVSSAVEAFPRPGPRRSGRSHWTARWGPRTPRWAWSGSSTSTTGPGAERELRRAIALDPGYATAHQWYAEYLSVVGRDADARLEAERAVALDPLSAIIRVDQALTLARGRHLDEAIAVLQQRGRNQSGLLGGPQHLGWVYWAAGRLQEAIAEHGGHRADEQRGRSGKGRLAYVYGRRDGPTPRWRSLESLSERFRRESIFPYSIALGYAGVGDDERVLDWLERAVAEHDPNVALYLRIDPLLRLAPAGSPIPAAAASGGIGVKPRMSSDLATRLQAALGDAYRIERELGGGGMSRLFVAEEASLHRRVVVKVLPPQFASEVSAARFRQEVEVAARLQHPNILPVLAAGTRDDLIYYIIPYVPGESLRHRLTREGRLPVPDALEILREVADALAYAHSEGILHRDIKPENVLLMGRHASLTDFGVARALSEARTGEPLTETGLAVGTPGYMAPEQAAGERHLDARADVYALAVVGYEMLTGKPPFEGPTAQAVLAAHLTITPRPLSEIRPEVPAGVSEVIARALHKSPVDRLRTAAELRDGLRVEMAVSAPPWRGLWWAAGVIALALIAGGLALFGRSRSPSRVDENLLAVAPFDAVSPSVEEYREGLLTILSRSLDGAGPIRTVSPTIVVRRWAGESDPASASALGRGTGAGLVVFGQVVPAGADSVRLSATIYDVRRERSAGEVEVRDDRQRIDRIADTLAVRLLREVGRTRPVGAVRFAALGSTSLPAIKLFLAAEQFYRRGQWDSTIVYAERAVAVDSDFTLALRRIPNALWWSNADVSPMLLRAGARNHGLAPRESLLVRADSIWGALDSDILPSWPLLRQLNATVRETVKRYPDDPEAWYMMGETAYHYGGQVAPRVSPRVAFDAFARALELDSAFAPAYEHIVDLALRLRDPETARRYGEAYLRVGSGRTGAASVRAALDLLASPNAPPPATVAFLDTAKAKQVWDAWFYIASAVDSGEAAVAAARAFTRSRHGPDSVDAERQRGLLGGALAYRGHLREAVRELWTHRPWARGRTVDPHRGRTGHAGRRVAGFGRRVAGIAPPGGQRLEPVGPCLVVGSRRYRIDSPARAAGPIQEPLLLWGNR